ncbi:MAG: MerR family transcriptional regulator [Chloroflexi bacterium]|nr:MerR family transcriptional regulator [Chloroflexota bacterium]
MAGTTYTIGEVAKTLGLEGKNSSTVRLWTETFADWLSPITRPVKGQLRLYTEADVRNLRLIRDLRRQHVSYDEVRQRLSAKRQTAVEKATGESPIGSPTEENHLAAVDGRELRELLAPVFEVSEAWRRFLKESDYFVGIHLELGRLASSIESLNAKLDLLRHDVETVRGELRRPAAALANEAASGEEHTTPLRSVDSDRSGRSDGLDGLVSTSTARRPIVAEGNPGTAVGLNEYGLRAVPGWLAGNSLGSFSLCRFCGSTAKPIGVTPTARAVLRCIQCQERATVPLAQLEKELGIKHGFLARLWRLLRHPLSRR